ncbi:MAG: restriction endonuclease [Fuerstiella sp.]|nr:restriction endonuclease [Fuerstiella sp.]MCP4854126.1 restriction endonuclease [Fuerstiella sp.]
MPIPDFQTCMLPILEVIEDADDWQMKQVTAAISDRFNLTDEEQSQMLPSGHARVIVNRVGWAKAYLKEAGLLLSPKRGVVRISPDGKAVLSECPDRIDMKYLERFPAYLEFRARKGSSTKTASTTGANDAVAETESSETPEERIDSAYQEMRAALADELLQQVKNGEDQFFERMVVELLVAMGYGGSFKDAGKAVGKSGDGGIDGVFKEDKLGLDVVVIQAKKWTENSVGRPAVQSFAGSMEGFRASKGVFITTSTFSQPAVEYVNTIQRRIVLIDGPALARLMIDHGIGVTKFDSYTLKRLDADYFDQ